MSFRGTPHDMDLQYIAEQLDSAEDRRRTSSLSRMKSLSSSGPNSLRNVPSLGASISPSKRGPEKTRSAPISVLNVPVKTTVGFGEGSMTKTTGFRTEVVSSSVPEAATAVGSPAQSKAAEPVAVAQTPPKNTPPANAHGGRDIKPKPKLSKKERRELQEAQRAAKAAKLAAQEEAGGKKSGGGKKPKQVSSSIAADVKKKKQKEQKTLAKHGVPQRESSIPDKGVHFFSHLEQYDRSFSLTKTLGFSASAAVHPAIIRLGLQLSDGTLAGSTERCIALLTAFKTIFREYRTPEGREMSRDLYQALGPYISFLKQCRPMSASMGNAIKFIKHEISHGIPPGMPEAEAREQLCGQVDQFIQERIVLAQTAISEYAFDRIQDADVLLVYGGSALIYKVLKEAHGAGRKFRVIVVDSRPKLTGREMLRKLVALGVQCSYCLISAVSYVMKEATKIFLGAHALLANGFFLGRVGSSMVAMMAKANNKPVLLCCETYKFCERVQTDSFVFNELGDPSDLVDLGRRGNVLDSWKETPALKILNLVLDATPPQFVDMVITEIGLIPCTSVPVVLRVKEEEGKH